MGGIATPIDIRAAEPNWPNDDRALRDESSWVFISILSFSQCWCLPCGSRSTLGC